MHPARYSILAALLLSTSAAAKAEPTTISYHSAKVEGVEIFYREAGAHGAPVLLLLHGRQTSSHMFRDLIPIIAKRYHVIAPDLPGFGQSGTPPLSEFAYTFDHLASVAEGLLKALSIENYGLVMQDYGVAVGFRMASAAPERINSLVIQNGEICEAKEKQQLWLSPFWEKRDPAAEQRLRNSYRLATTIKYYQLGAAKPETISPDAWALSQYYLDQPGRHDAQVELMHDFPSNVARYPAWQDYLRKHKPPTLVLWGKDSPIYSVERIQCYREANPDAVVRIYSGGHFLLEEHAAAAGAEILKLKFPKSKSRRGAHYEEDEGATRH
jgi:pimeloyl-ACP methyl ester carboxylesterase